MGTIKKRFKYVGILLSMMILVQSCRVYQHQTSTLDDAIQQERRVKIETINDETLKFNKVEFVDAVYYGVSKEKKVEVRTSIDTENIKKIRLQNKTMSVVYTVGIGVVVVATVGVVAVFEAIDDL